MNRAFKTSHFDVLQDYIAGGCTMDLTDEEQEYYNALYAVLGISRKYGKEAAVSFLMHDPFRVERSRARQMYAEALNLFYVNDNIENEAHRNMLFDNLQKAALVVLQNATSSKDMEVYGNLLTQASRIKQLDKPDPVKPIEPDEKPIKLYDLRTEAVGLPSSNRSELARLIDNLQGVSEKEKVRLRRDAGITDVDIEEMINDQEDKTRDFG